MIAPQPYVLRLQQGRQPPSMYFGRSGSQLLKPELTPRAAHFEVKVEAPDQAD